MKFRGMAYCLCFAIVSACMGSPAFSEGLTFGLVAKSVDDGNFIEAWKGCDEAAKMAGDSCVLLGAKGSAQLREQAQAIEEALKTQKLDALAISVINSDFVATALQGTTIPVITYDSPFSEKHKGLSRAYVGSDNVEFGKDLAKIAKQLKPAGKSVCLMSVQHDQNLSLRMQGVRQELSGDSAFPAEKKLAGEGGWTESDRSPWNVEDDAKRSLSMLKYTLTTIKPDIFLAVGHWPVVDIEEYKKTVTPFHDALADKEQAIIVGIGTHSLPELEKLMSEDLVQGFACIDFNEIGKKCYETMKQLAEGQNVDPVVTVPNIIRVKE